MTEINSYEIFAEALCENAEAMELCNFKEGSPEKKFQQSLIQAAREYRESKGKSK